MSRSWTSLWGAASLCTQTKSRCVSCLDRGSAGKLGVLRDGGSIRAAGVGQLCVLLMPVFYSLFSQPAIAVGNSIRHVS
jgi:hypothetical protein